MKVAVGLLSIQGATSASLNVQLVPVWACVLLAGGRALGCKKKRPEPGGHFFLTQGKGVTRMPRKPTSTRAVLCAFVV